MGRVISTGRALALGLGLAAVVAGGLRAQEPRPEGRIDLDEVIVSSRGGRVIGGAGGGSESHFRNFNEVVQGAEKIDGLFTLHKKGEHLYAEIRNDQFNHPMLLPVTIASAAWAPAPACPSATSTWSSSSSGPATRSSSSAAISTTRRRPRRWTSRSSRTTSTRSSCRCRSSPSTRSARRARPWIDLSDIFLNDFALARPFGGVDRSRSGWHRVKGVPEQPRAGGRADLRRRAVRPSSTRATTAWPDRRGITLVVHYSLMRAPDMGYHPPDGRRPGAGPLPQAPPRRTSARPTPTPTSSARSTAGGLEKADPRGRSPRRPRSRSSGTSRTPSRSSTAWPYVESGIREWNKAFEKIGYVDAIAVLLAARRVATISTPRTRITARSAG